MKKFSKIKLVIFLSIPYCINVHGNTTEEEDDSSYIERDSCGIKKPQKMINRFHKKKDPTLTQIIKKLEKKDRSITTEGH